VTGTLEAVSTEPITPIELCVGLVGFPFAFALGRAAIYLAIAALWLGLETSGASWLGLAIVLAASGAAIAPLGVIAAASVLVFKRGGPISAALMYALTILGGMVFPISTLPQWLEPLASVAPLRYAFDGARDALFAGSGWGFEAIVLAAWAVALWAVALAVFEQALAHAKTSGSLAHY
jgi:ABC-type polysaccharide/polyol phosphate export permease